MIRRVLAQPTGRLAVGILSVIAFLAIFAFNYVFEQTLLATHPELLIIK